MIHFSQGVQSTYNIRCWGDGELWLLNGLTPSECSPVGMGLLLRVHYCHLDNLCSSHFDMNQSVHGKLSFGTTLFKGHLHLQDTKFGPRKILT